MVCVFVCDRCKDQQTTIKLLCSKALPAELFKHIGKYNRCLACDGREKAIKFKTIMRNISHTILPLNLSLAKQSVRDRSLVKHLNIITFHYLEWVYKILSDLNNKDVKDFRKNSFLLGF